MSGMKNNSSKFNPTVAFVTVAVLVSIIVLVFVLRSGSSEPEPAEPPVVDQSAEPRQPVDPPEPPAQPPEQQPSPTPPEPSDPPVAPPAGQLPDNWDDLTSAQKTELNPLDCDIETEWISAEDGSCIAKTENGPPPVFTGRRREVSTLTFDDGRFARVLLEGWSCEEYVPVDYTGHPLRGYLIDIDSGLGYAATEEAIKEYLSQHPTDVCQIKGLYSVGASETVEGLGLGWDIICPSGDGLYHSIFISDTEGRQFGTYAGYGIATECFYDPYEYIPPTAGEPLPDLANRRYHAGGPFFMPAGTTVVDAEITFSWGGEDKEYRLVIPLSN